MANTGASSASASRTASTRARSRQTSSPNIRTGHFASPSFRAIASTVFARAGPGRSIWYAAASPICASSPSRSKSSALIERYTGPVGGVVASRSARVVATVIAAGFARPDMRARASLVIGRIDSACVSPGYGARPRKSWSSEAQSPAITSSDEPAICALKSWPASCHEPPIT